MQSLSGHTGTSSYLPTHGAARGLLLVANHALRAVLKVFSLHTPDPLTQQSPSKKNTKQEINHGFPLQPAGLLRRRLGRRVKHREGTHCRIELLTKG